MKAILSIQSHVAYGYVGNRAAVFPLQRMGFDVSAINTVQFSNHTGYGSWTGEVFTPDHIRTLVDGLRDRGALTRFDAVLSGYLGDAALGQVVLDTVAEIRAANPNCIYCCDPVMGDVGRGLFVRPDIPAMFRDKMAPLASILTPNLFELEHLTGVTIQSLEEARAACKQLHARGVQTVLVTSLVHVSTPPQSVQMLVSVADGSAHLVTTPLLPMDPMPNGTGDLTAALFLGHTLNGCNVVDALALTAEGIFGVLEATDRAKTRELALITAQDLLAAAGGTAPRPHRFPPITLGI